MTRFNLLHARRWLLVGAALLLAVATVACTDDNSPTDVNEDDLPTNLLEIRVGPDGIDPPQEQIRVPDQYQLVVTNESDQDCSFYLGALVRDLEVAPGEKAQTDVQIPPTNGEDNQVDMGCLGDDTRQGTVIIRNATGSSLGVD